MARERESTNKVSANLLSHTSFGYLGVQVDVLAW